MKTLHPAFSDFGLAPLFRDLDRTLLADVAAHAQWRELDTGQTLFSRGEAGRHFFLLKQGAVRLHLLSESGLEHTIEIVRREQLFAEAVMFMGGNYPVHASALEPSRLIAFDATHFHDRLLEQPRLGLNMLAAMSRHLHALVQDIDRLTMQQGARRLAQYLLAQPGILHSGERVIQLPASKQAIASLLDIRPETLSRLLARFSDDGLIRVRQAEIGLLQPERLNQIE